MKLTLFYIPVRMLPVVLLCITYALLQAMAFRPVLSFPFGLLLLKSAADSLVFVGAGMLLVIAIRSSNYVKLDKYQRLVNYFTLGFLYVALWTGLSYLLSLLIFGREHGEEIRIMIPLTALIGLFIYLIHLLIIHFQMLRKEGEAETDDHEVENEQPDMLQVHGNENGNGEETLERVAVKTGQKIHVILVPDIVYIQSDGDYVQIVTGQARYLKEETMKYFEASLPRSKFVRVHRSYIVNVEKILRIELYEKQNQMLTLKNGDQIRASVSGYKELRTILNL
ncbi:MAG: LytTR family transcriptional regulator DNA-binding domain-containing protein [Proteiniphilum sp.]|nr:LytTR family transcriptional regulator DNA-binding domain-containing protein [Proteiniphilum sp.]